MKADVGEILARGTGAESTKERWRVRVCLLTGHAGRQALLSESAYFPHNLCFPRSLSFAKGVAYLILLLKLQGTRIGEEPEKNAKKEYTKSG